MKLSIDKNELQHGLSRVQAIVEKRNTMPILANVLLKAEKHGKQGALQLAATDLEVGLRSQLVAMVSEGGSLTTPARKLYEIVRELPDGQIEIQRTENSYLELRCARSHFTLAGTSAEEYPTLPDASLSNLVKIHAAVLSSMIERTMYATSSDETRYNLNGVLLEVSENRDRLRMVATDGHRLAYVDRNVPLAESSLTGNIIIPRKGLAEIKRLVDEEDADEVEIGFEQNSGLLRKGDIMLTMRLIEGEFPNYRQVIPQSLKHKVAIPVDVLGQVLRRAALLSSERSRAVKLEFSTGQLVVSSNNPDYGEAREELDANFEGDKLAIGFNARYLLDAVGALGGKEVEFGLQDSLSPALLHSTEDPDAAAVVMPMRL